jgi:hypothetical protein
LIKSAYFPVQAIDNIIVVIVAIQWPMMTEMAITSFWTTMRPK